MSSISKGIACDKYPKHYKDVKKILISNYIDDGHCLGYS
jgi:hypothetical protein